MPLFSFEGKSPSVHPTAFIAPTAVLVGDVTVEENASVWYNAVLRADFNPIVVRRGANVQDCAVVHVTPRQGTEVGVGATIGHNCTVHLYACDGGLSPRKPHLFGKNACWVRQTMSQNQVRIMHLGVTSNYLYMLSAAHLASPISIHYATCMGRRRKPRFMQKFGES